MVFMPGTMTHPLFYEEFLDGVAQAGFSVVGVHLQSHGKGPRTSRSFSFEDLVQNGLDVVSYAIERFGTSVIVVYERIVAPEKRCLNSSSIGT